MPDYITLPTIIGFVLLLGCVAFMFGYLRKKRVLDHKLAQQAKQQVDELNDEQLQRFVATVALWNAMTKRDQQSVLQRRFKNDPRLTVARSTVQSPSKVQNQSRRRKQKSAN